MTAYPQFPTLHGDTLVFVAEDDVWAVSVSGGTARRLTANKGKVSHPSFSPDGTRLAYVGSEEGASDIYVIDSSGGPSRRVTFQGSRITWVGWKSDGETIRYSSAAEAHVGKFLNFWEVKNGQQPERLTIGYGTAVADDGFGTSVIWRGNPGTPAAHWKRYRGGTAGHLWIDRDGTGDYRRMNELSGYVENPHFVGGRLYFLSDFEGYGNVYSVDYDGANLQRHTDHAEYYARDLTSDGTRLAYRAGGDLYLLDPANHNSHQIPVTIAVTSTRMSRRFVDPMRYLHAASMTHDGKSLVLNTRAKVFHMRPFDGPVTQLGDVDQTAYRLPTPVAGGESVLAIGSSTENEEYLVELSVEADQEPRILPCRDFGRVTEIVASPMRRSVVMNNHRGELLHLDLEADEPVARVVDSSPYSSIEDVAYSPDGNWVAYTAHNAAPDGNEILASKSIYLHHLPTQRTILATRNVWTDEKPVFDPDGKFLYFIGHREFAATKDSLKFDYGFMWGLKPYAIVLDSATKAPFRHAELPDSEEGDKETTPDVRIDEEGLIDRVVPLPVEAGDYTKLMGAKGKVLTLSRPPTPNSSGDIFADQPAADQILRSVDLVTGKVETIAEGVSTAWNSTDGSTVLYRAGNSLRVLKAGEKAPEGEEPGHETGIVDLKRVKVSVQPGKEWPQMFAEAWRLMRDHFWNKSMGGLDWDAVFHRYAPLAQRVSSRAEFSDLLWEMQGEVNTSHAYELLGDHPGAEAYPVGHLAADIAFDEESGTYRVRSIAQGDRWNPEHTSPLNLPGVNVVVGDEILAVNGMPVGSEASVAERLINLAGQEVQLTVRSVDQKKRRVTVTPLGSDNAIRYRDWVAQNRQAVHEATGGRVGYVHVPDMMADGFAEFHRGFLAEHARHALIVDFRYNGGGNVSQLVLDQLQRTRVGYFSKPNGAPHAQPLNARRGPLVGLTNEFAGSDGDIVGHGFKQRGLGRLIGKRSWGGVVGISVRFFLADNTLVTQPEAASFLDGAGWGVENYGVEPDIEVEYAPQDFVKGSDPQLRTAISQALKELETASVHSVSLTEKPDLTVPALPPRPQHRS